jgi:hypothetical protein
MEIPSALRHKPVIVSEQYDQIDGRAAGSSDAMGLSLGLAQWNDRGTVDISAKVWRHTGNKWSRQSEELPLHRVLDLAILVCRAREYFAEAYRQPEPYDPERPGIDRIPLQGGALNVAVAVGNERIADDMRLFQAALAKDDELIGERLRRLGAILDRLGY